MLASAARRRGVPVIDIPGYRIDRVLGQGGMAVVYLAEQLSLGRAVALKVLAPALAHDPIASERFLREARYAAKLHHPNVIEVHEVGSHAGTAFMAVAYEPGGSIAGLLPGPIDVRRALRIVRDIADALDYAHKRGVVHRDVKPQNILLRDDGGCVLGDFGIALAMETGVDLTGKGNSVGTPSYMSPEQLRGERVDGRADLYSLGVVLFQILAGDVPYRGSDTWAVGQQHMTAPLPDLPREFAPIQSLVHALMAKTPDGRPQTGADVVRWIDSISGSARSETTKEVTADPMPVKSPDAESKAWLWFSGAAVALMVAIVLWNARLGVGVTDSTAGPERPSIAVLPFADMSQTRDQEYFSDGIAEELIHVLAQIPQLDVAGRTSAFSFKGQPDDIATIGRKLGVAHILEGSLRKSGDQVRITVQLVKVDDGFHLWSQTFDRDIKDLFEVQDEIAAAVATELRVQLIPGRQQAIGSSSAQHADGVFAEYKRAYYEGMLAAKSGRWSDVRRRMNEAIAGAPDPSSRIRLFGARFAAYVPRYFLGMAAYKQGDCAEAASNLGHAATLEVLREAANRAMLEVAQAAIASCGLEEGTIPGTPAVPDRR